MSDSTNSKYSVDVEVTDGKVTRNYKLLVTFSTDTGLQSFGNKTTMYVCDREEGNFERFYDIRYDKHYSPQEQFTYIVRWAETLWNSKWRLTSISVFKTLNG